VSADADGDGEAEQLEIWRIQDPRFPLVARWSRGPAAEPREAVWAVASHLLVRVEPGAEGGASRVKQTFEDTLDRHDLEVRALPMEGTFLVGVFPGHPAFPSFGDQGELFAALQELRGKNAGNAVLEPDYLLFPDKEPIDPKYKAGFQSELTAIKAQKAWDAETGSAQVRIAVLDSGIDANHPTFANAHILKNPGSDVVRGDDDPDDEGFHGSFCAALAGSPADNKGMVGVNWEVTLMPIKFIDGQDCGTEAEAALAVDNAIEHEADVISASWGGLAGGSTLRDAISRANTAGILFVASAGNSHRDLDTKKYFPASYPLPNILVVGAADNSGSPLARSGFGRSAVHLSAPGAQVFSAVANRAVFYAEGDGTSPAVAFVSGAAALVKAKTPALTLRQLRCRLVMSAAPPMGNTLAAASCSAGLLNLENAVKGKNLRNVCGCP